MWHVWNKEFSCRWGLRWGMSLSQGRRETLSCNVRQTGWKAKGEGGGMVIWLREWTMDISPSVKLNDMTLSNNADWEWKRLVFCLFGLATGLSILLSLSKNQLWVLLILFIAYPFSILSIFSLLFPFFGQFYLCFSSFLKWKLRLFILELCSSSFIEVWLINKIV